MNYPNLLVNVRKTAVHLMRNLFIILIVIAICGAIGGGTAAILLAKKQPKKQQPCDGVVCGKSSSCVNGVCVCKSGWSGSDCDTPVRPNACIGTDAQVCSGNGRCDVADDGSGRCVCADGYTGGKCQDPPTPPSCSLDCGAHGSCKLGDGGSQSCVCADGYTGGKCQDPPTPPSCSLDCGAHGSCGFEADGKTQRCECTDGYFGDRCQNAPPSCSLDCGAHGSCKMGQGLKQSCVCTDGYTGSACSIPPTPPSCSLDCGAHGSCRPGVNGGPQTCVCDGGYTGPDCSVPPSHNPTGCIPGQYFDPSSKTCTALPPGGGSCAVSQLPRSKTQTVYVPGGTGTRDPILYDTNMVSADAVSGGTLNCPGGTAYQLYPGDSDPSCPPGSTTAFRAYMGVGPSAQASNYFASQGGFYQSWIDKQEQAGVPDSILISDVTVFGSEAWPTGVAAPTDFTSARAGALAAAGSSTASGSSFWTLSNGLSATVYKPLSDIPELGYDKLTDWRSGPCVKDSSGSTPAGCPGPGDAFYEDWSCGMLAQTEAGSNPGAVAPRADSMFGTIAKDGFNAKGIELPDRASASWDDNTELIWDETLGKYICRLRTTLKWDADLDWEMGITGFFKFVYGDSGAPTTAVVLDPTDPKGLRTLDVSSIKVYNPQEGQTKADARSLRAGDRLQMAKAGKAGGLAVIKSFSGPNITFQSPVTKLTWKPVPGQPQSAALVVTGAAIIWSKGTWVVEGTGGLVSNRSYASGRYEVRAKVPAASGMVWAIWTWNGNYDTPGTRACKPGLSANDCGAMDCDSIGACVGKGAIPTGTAIEPTWVDCIKEGFDPAGPACLGGYPFNQTRNQEIDWEAPTNCPQTTNAMAAAQPVFEAQNLDTFNGNAYRWTNNAGTGTYVNQVFRRVDPATGKPGPPSTASAPGQFATFGDGKYHTYAFEWHTGDRDGAASGAPGDSCGARIDYYFDGDYVGSVDSFIPTQASRLWITLWNTSNKNWNGQIKQSPPPPTGAPTTGVPYADVDIDWIRIRPFYESGDSYGSFVQDQPWLKTGVNVGITNPAKGGASCCKLDSRPGYGCIPWAHGGKICEDGSSPVPQAALPYVADNGYGIGSICWQQPVGAKPPAIGSCAPATPSTSTYSCVPDPFARYYGDVCKNPPGNVPCTTTADCTAAATTMAGLCSSGDKPVTAAEFQGYCETDKTPSSCHFTAPDAPPPPPTPKQSVATILASPSLTKEACCEGSHVIEASCGGNSDCAQLADACEAAPYLASYNPKQDDPSVCDPKSSTCYLHPSSFGTGSSCTTK